MSLSPLQLGNGTVLLIDETNLGTGQLNEKGTRSVSALQSIATTQHLPMSYPYYELKVPTDLPIIIFTATSNGASLIGSEAFKIVLRDSPSLLPQDRQGDIEGKDEWEGVCSDVWRSRARLWWASVREKDVSMKEDLAVSGIESFANARQIDTRLTQSDFHRWLTVSRLLAISEGSQNINSIHWGTMRKMEGERLDRYFSI